MGCGDDGNWRAADGWRHLSFAYVLSYGLVMLRDCVYTVTTTMTATPRSVGYRVGFRYDDEIGLAFVVAVNRID